MVFLTSPCTMSRESSSSLDRKAVEQPLNAIVQIPDCSPTVFDPEW